MIVIAPLMNYNTEYFGGPFKSGYDATPVNEFRPDDGLAARNQSTGWANTPHESLEAIGENFIILTPVFLSRMPCLLFLPFGVYIMRKNEYIMLLLPWIIIIFLTYMSLSWVSMYAHLLEVVVEPRYFMPALPPIAILAGVGIDGIAFRNRSWSKSHSNNKQSVNNKRAASTLNITGGMFVILIVFSLAFAGIIPAENHFHELRELTEKGLPEKLPGLNQQPSEVIPVTTDQLSQEPDRYLKIFVSVKGANVTRVGQVKDRFWIRSIDSKSNTSVEVHLESWPVEKLPELTPGLQVNVNGRFVKQELAEQEPRYMINVKYGTIDFVKVLN